MPKVLVLPAGEDQSDFAAGRRPGNHYDRDFPTIAAAKSYEDGVGSVNDLVEYEVKKDEGLRLEIMIGGDRVHIDFATEAEKEAYKQGLEDGDGFVSPAVHLEGTSEFEALQNLLATAPSP